MNAESPHRRSTIIRSRSKRPRASLRVGIALAVTILTVFFWRAMDHDLERLAQVPLAVMAGNTDISGTVWLPRTPPLAVVALVHGDGPAERGSGGDYAPIINAMVDAGIAVASWDKPGIGQSGGNWLDQSMEDRATELRAALDELRHMFPDLKVGAMGFSQAGWVLPRLRRDEADFLLLVGAAVSWQSQGDYYTRTRLGIAGHTEAEINRALEREERDDERIFGPHATPERAPDGMTTDRWAFIRRNRFEDARTYLPGLDIPLLALWGDKDLNVDAARDSATYESIAGTADLPIGTHRIANATHGLLRASAYNWQLPDQWSWAARLRFFVEGRYAYASGALDTVTTWILGQAASPNTPEFGPVQ
ncbi:MAG: alpha/beta hydrolase [Cognatishimia sp.]